VSVQSIERTAAILRAIADRQPSGARLTDIARSLDLSKSTTHRILATLIDCGLVEQSGRSGLFYLGPEAVVIGAAAAGRHHLLDAARRTMVRLADRSADTVYLTTRIGFEAVCLAREDGAYPVKTLVLDVGGRLPLGVGGGNIAILAFLPDDDVAHAIEANMSRISTRWHLDQPHLASLVGAARDHGYAFVDGEFIPGMASVGVPIIGQDGQPIASLSIAAISDRMQKTRRSEIAGWLLREARFIETRMTLEA
jgi:DNA-binding IclR family transcriptional regulator